jgi:hypothetical protein
VAAFHLTQEVGVAFDGQVTLVGVVVNDRTIELPGFVHIALIWRSDIDHPPDFSVQMQLLDSSGQTIDEIVTPPVDGRYPASLWTAGEMVRDQYSFWLDESYTPQTYTLRARPKKVGEWVSLGEVDVVDGY